MIPVVAAWLSAYLLTGALIVLGVRLIWVACDRLPLWSLLLALLGVAGLVGYTLWVHNLLAIIGVLTVGLAAALIWLLVWVPRVLPQVTDTVLRLWHSDHLRRRPAGTRP
jgi:hypothetical protein